MLNLPPNQPVPVNQPPGGRLQIVNNETTMNCNFIILNPNSYLIDVVFANNPMVREGGLLKFTLNPNQRADILISIDGNPTYYGIIPVIVINITKNNFSACIFEMPHLEVFLMTTFQAVESMEFDIKEIKRKLEHLGHIGDYK